RQAGVDVLPAAAGEVAEYEAFDTAAVERVGVHYPVRRHLELVDPERPADAPAESELEARERFHHQRVRVLRVETEIADDRRTPVPPLAGLGALQVVRPAVLPLAGIVVDHLNAVTDRARQQFLRRNFYLRHENVPASPARDAGILRNDGHPPRGGQRCGAFTRWGLSCLVH